MNITVHPWIGSNPIEIIDRFKKSALLWNLATTISSIAMGAISFSVGCAALFVNVPMSIIIFGTVIAPPILSFAISCLNEKALSLESQIKNEQPIADEFEKILSWNESQIISFLEENKIPIPIAIPLSRLLPVIARYRARSNQADFYDIKSKALLESKGIKDRGIRLWQGLEGWRYREEVILPARVEAAFCLAVLKNPNLKGLPTDHFNFLQKSFAARFLNLSFDQEDDYLEFLIQKRDPITFEELQKISDPKMVYELLYR